MANPSQARHSDEAMYRWLQQELSKLHAEVLDEPLPPEMEDLVRRCEDKLFGQSDEDR